ncbi:MAG: CoA transferase [Rubrivivax sp.]|nr:CoA transferase [Rubrivivax sp.]
MHPAPRCRRGAEGSIAAMDCARLMADLGADVVKVEPSEGDDMRLRQPLRAAPDGSRHSAPSAS